MSKMTHPQGLYNIFEVSSWWQDEGSGLSLLDLPARRPKTLEINDDDSGHYLWLKLHLQCTGAVHAFCSDLMSETTLIVFGKGVQFPQNENIKINIFYELYFQLYIFCVINHFLYYFPVTYLSGIIFAIYIE